MGRAGPYRTGKGNDPNYAALPVRERTAGKAERNQRGQKADRDPWKSAAGLSGRDPGIGSGGSKGRLSVHHTAGGGRAGSGRCCPAEKLPEPGEAVGDLAGIL